MRNSKGQFVEGYKTGFEENLSLGHGWNKGKKCPEIGEKLRGTKRPDLAEYNRKYKKGSVLSEETKKKMSISRKGKRYKSYGKPAPHRSGEKSNFWKGGVTELNLNIRNSLEYRLWRTKIFERDNYCCQKCSAKSKVNCPVVLNADHIKPLSAIIKEYEIICMKQAVSCKELWNIENGRTLCVSCHRKTKTFGKKAVNYLINNTI
jgi:hypothetical protein